jgi:phosphate transport system substrate-binding protein
MHMLGRTRNAAIVVTIIASMTSGLAFADELKVGGTGAAYGLLQLLGDAFVKASNRGDTVETVPGLGSSGSISAVMDGALHLSVSGRPLTSEEQEKGAKSLQLLETPFIFVTSHPSRQKLTTTNIIEIFNGTMKVWPDGKEIRPILRPKSDAASVFLVANITGMSAAMEQLRKRPDVPVAATDQDNAELAVRVANSLTAMTLIQFLTEKPQLRIIELNDAEPSVDAIQGARYSLKTKLHLIQGPQASDVATRFIAFLETPEAVKIITNHGGIVLGTRAVAN